MFVFKLEHAVETFGYLIFPEAAEEWFRWPMTLIIAGGIVALFGVLLIAATKGDNLAFFTTLAGIVIVITGAVVDAVYVYPEEKDRLIAVAIEQQIEAVKYSNVDVEGDIFVAFLDGQRACGEVAELDDGLFVHPTECPN